MLPATPSDYSGLLESVSELLKNARRASARALNAILTSTYWEIGRRIVKHEQSGHLRAEYGKALLVHLSADLTKRFGRGFSTDNLETMRLFYNAYPASKISETLSRKSGLLELGGDFAFIGRQRRLRIGNEWYRVDLVFYHRRLKCLILIDLKLGRFSHADAGQMHLYLNYAREHWTRFDENPPVGLILCADKNAAVAKYALEDLPNKVLAAEYKLVLPKEDLLISEL